MSLGFNLGFDGRGEMLKARVACFSLMGERKGTPHYSCKSSSVSFA